MLTVENRNVKVAIAENRANLVNPRFSIHGFKTVDKILSRWSGPYSSGFRRFRRFSVCLESHTSLAWGLLGRFGKKVFEDSKINRSFVISLVIGGHTISPSISVRLGSNADGAVSWGLLDVIPLWAEAVEGRQHRKNANSTKTINHPANDFANDWSGHYIALFDLNRPTPIPTRLVLYELRTVCQFESNTGKSRQKRMSKRSGGVLRTQQNLRNSSFSDIFSPAFAISGRGNKHFSQI